MRASWNPREGVLRGGTARRAQRCTVRTSADSGTPESSSPLVYFELHTDMYEAIRREKRLKKWNRAWKIRLIEELNPEWNDLPAQAF